MSPPAAEDAQAPAAGAETAEPTGETPAPTAIEDSPGSAAAVDAPSPGPVDPVTAPFTPAAEPAGDDAAAEPAPDEATADAAAATPEQISGEQNQSTVVLPAAAEAGEAPRRGAYDPAAIPRKPGFRERGRMRRRLRYLREVRELGFRDLGGLVFDQHRFQRPNEALVQGKVAAIDAIDRESRALAAALGERTDYSELFVAGVSACQRCGTLHGSEARFCPHCGLAFSGPRFLAGVGAGDEPYSGDATATPGQAALFDPQAARAAESAAPADTAAGPQVHDGAS